MMKYIMDRHLKYYTNEGLIKVSLPSKTLPTVPVENVNVILSCVFVIAAVLVPCIPNLILYTITQILK